MNIRWMTNACFNIYNDEVSVVTDPCILQSSYKGFKAPFFDRVDHVVLSHLHWDHITELKSVLETFNPSIFTGVQGSERLAEYLDLNTSYLFPMYPDQSLDMGEVKITALYNRHADVKFSFSQQTERCISNGVTEYYPGLEKLQGIGGMEMYSYILEFKNGFKVLFWGGNISQNQITRLRGLKPDVALMQYSKQGPEALSELAQAIDPRVLIPHHHDLRTPFAQTLGKLEELKRLYPGELLCPENGEVIRI